MKVPKLTKKDLIDFWNSLTLEPVIFVFSFAWSILAGAQLQTNLLMWKVCHLEKGYNETICDNLTLDEYEDIQTEVQKRVNNFDMSSEWIGRTPTLVYSFFAGSLSDDFGRKPLLILPVLGFTIGMVFNFINYGFIRTLPTEFFWLSSNFYQFLGGSSVYYLGIYGYGSAVTTPKNRVTVFARYDALELIGYVAGSFVSPVIFKKLGYYGNYTITLVLMLLCLAYLIVFIPEVLEKKSMAPVKNVCHWFQIYLVKPCLAMLKTVFKPRKNWLRAIILVQILAYGLLWFNLGQGALEYLYMLKVFEGYTETEYANFSAIGAIVMALNMFFIIPLLKFHESLYVMLALLGQAVSFFAQPWTLVPWQYYVAQIASVGQYGIWASARTIFTYCVDPNEIGKIYAAVGIVAALCPLAANVIYRQLYDKTLESFPGAIYICAGSVNLLMIFLYGLVFYNRGQMASKHDDNDNENELDEIKGKKAEDFKDYSSTRTSTSTLTEM